MFANGGPTTPSGPLGPNQVYDTVTGKFYNLDEDFVDNLFFKGFNLYPILRDDTLVKGSNVAASLEKFRDRDEPFDLSRRSGGFFQPRDVGTGLLDTALYLGKTAEPYVKKGIAGFGELTGLDFLKKADDDVRLGLLGFKRDQSIFPTDEERSRSALERITNERPINLDAQFKTASAGPNINLANPEFRLGDTQISGFSPKVKGAANIISQLVGRDPIFDIDEDIAELNQPDVVDTAVVTEEQSGPTPVVTGETLGELTEEEALQKRINFEKEMIGRDEFGELLPESRLTKDDEINNLLEEIKPAEIKVDVEKTPDESKVEVEEKFSGLPETELQTLIDEAATPKLPSIERPTVDTTVDDEAPKTPPDSVSKKLAQPGFFGSDRFLNFIRNVGGELVRTGQFGEGLASGAAKAAEERAARELMADQERRKFLDEVRLEKIKSGLEDLEGFSPTEADKIMNVEQALSSNIQDFEKSRNTLSNLNKVISILDAGGATGLRGFFGEFTDMVEAAIKADNNGKSFEELKPRTRANSLLKVLRQANVREILGESGKTISNLDRQIVEEVFGDIKITTPVAVSLKKLEDSRKNIINGMMQTQNALIANKSFFDRIGYNAPILSINKSILDLIGQFTFDNAESYIDDTPASVGYIETSL
tara:strand:+ start:2782 stop:4737 length:1956 start_codon:yes stop_codon:yes gene_type:complete